MGQNIFKINILKLDHRPERDKRITTHCALVSRAFGAENMFYSGVEDNNFEKNVVDVCDKWGSDFKVKFVKNPFLFVKEKKKDGFLIVHLTMYGELIDQKIKDLKKNLKMLVVIGGPKVLRKYYDVADYNIAVGSQPHSEVAALALFFYLLDKNCLNKTFDSKIKIKPSKSYKNIINSSLKK